MPYADNIVQSINGTLSAEMNNVASLQNHILYCIAEPAQTNDENNKQIIQPTVINLDGECTPVTHDDSYSLVAFHTITTETLQGVDNMSFGNKSQDWITSLADIELIVFANRTKVKMSPRVLSGQIIAFMPASQISITDTQNKKIATGSLAVTSVNYDSLSIFGRIYRNVEYFIGGDIMLFSIRYQLESNFRKECFNTCAC